MDATLGAARLVEVELGPLSLDDLHERVAPEAAGVVHRDARRLVDHEEALVAMEQPDWRCRHARLLAHDDVLQLVSVTERVLRLHGLSVEQQAPARHHLVEVGCCALRRELLRHHIWHTTPQPPPLGKRGEGEVVRPHVAPAVTQLVPCSSSHGETTQQSQLGRVAQTSSRRCLSPPPLILLLITFKHAASPREGMYATLTVEKRVGAFASTAPPPHVWGVTPP